MTKIWIPLSTLTTVPLFVLGIGAMFVPQQMLELLDLAPKGVYGWSTIRADVGGLLLGTGLLIVSGAFFRNPVCFLAAALLVSIALLGRIVRFAIDGMSSAAIPAVVVETEAILFALLARRQIISTEVGGQ